MESKAVSILSKLISIPTVNPPGEKYAEFVEYVEKLFKTLGLDTEIIEVPKSEVAKRCAESQGFISTGITMSSRRGR